MDSKKWYQSKSVWTAIVTTALGGLQGISTAMGHPVVIPNWVYSILAGMGLYALRTADKPIG